MPNDSSLGGLPSSTFDFDSQKGIMALLASVRASALSSVQKNELRDLAFLYMNGGKDQSVRLTLQQKVASYNLQSVLSPAAKFSIPEQPVYGFGTSRPAPSFSATTHDSYHAPSSPVSVVPPVQFQEPVAVPVPAPVQAQSVPPVPPVPPAPPAPPVPPVPPVVVEPPYDAEAAAQRIRQIKSLVNEKVGNPVNLVDINNEVGREYMAALLDAMKKLNGGTSVASAMKRLEDAFMVVETTLQNHVATLPAVPIPTAPIASVETPLSSSTPSPAEPTPVPEVEVTQVPVRVISPEPVLDSKPIDIILSQVVPDIATASEVAHDEVTAVPLREQSPWVISGFAQPQNPDDVVSIREDIGQFEPPTAAVPPHNQETIALVQSAWGPATDTLQPSTAPTAVPKRTASLAESTEKLHVLTDLPHASEMVTSSVAGDPLFIKEVDDGLEQLLLEWPIFKKSGLFGTGPKGRQHPLFIKIAPLQIALLLAGRFEGATQEVKQSITDYMNGWRYEQGIIYQQGETFEHYLRRVIRHILDLQKNHQNP